VIEIESTRKQGLQIREAMLTVKNMRKLVR